MDFSFVSLFCPLHIEVLSPWIGVIDPIILRGDGFDPLENSQNLQAHVRPDTFLVLPLDRRKQNWLFGWIACPEGGNLGPSADDDDEAEAEGGEGSAGHNEGGRNAEAGGDGYGLADAVQQPRRTVPDGCAACMEPMCSGDRVCWSANETCPHAFHEECILDWLLVLGNKKRMRQIRADPGSAEVVAAEVLTDFPMQCPCCRQDFVKAKAKLITPSEEGGDVEDVVEDVMVEAVEP